MKRLSIRYFAAFREATGVEREEVRTAAGSPAELFGECAARFDRLHAFTRALVAINDEMTDWDASLSDGDEVLFFPPVAGG